MRCSRVLPLDCFYKHPAMADGRLNKCKECTRKEVRLNRLTRIEQYRDYEKRRALNPDRVAARAEYAKTEAGIEAHRRANRTYSGTAAAAVARHRYIATNPEKRAAHIAVGNAVRDGRLKRQPCRVCGSSRVHGHHEDYSKPLAVDWLCPKHHRHHHVTRGEQFHLSILVTP